MSASRSTQAVFAEDGAPASSGRLDVVVDPESDQQQQTTNPLSGCAPHTFEAPSVASTHVDPAGLAQSPGPEEDASAAHPTASEVANTSAALTASPDTDATSDPTTRTG